MEKIIIVGGGIAGLAAGVYALKAGFEAEIYEKNPVPGGECMGWNRKGYHIDNCIH
jgi:phytoene dehydrogenase-like protein